MDRYELKVSLDEIDDLIEERRFAEAVELADTIDWTRIRSVHVLCKISDLYKINRRYKDSRDLMEMAYERNPSGRKIIYSLCELELKLNNYIHALQLYNAFINVAPRDSDRFLLQYKLYKKQDVNVYEQIAVLEEFLQHDFRERWAYELATLYLRAGEEQRCISQCDEIVAYFGDGRFVIRALELKKSLTSLTPQQEERLEVLRNGGTIAPPVSRESISGEENGKRAGAAAAEESSSVKESSAAEESAEKPASGGKKTAAEKPAAAGKPEAGEKPAAAEKPAAGKKPAAEGKNLSGGQSAESRQEGRAERPLPGTAEGSAGKPASGREKAAAEKPAAGKTSSAAEKSAGSRREEAAERFPAYYAPEEAEEDADDDGGEPAASPEEYTDALLRDVKMQETLARGMREIGEYDELLAQESGGQLAMVMEEEPPEEETDGGQLDLEKIMSEWEKIRKDSEQQRLAQARRRVMERSEAAKRELYGEEASADIGDTRPWKREEIESGLRKEQGTETE